MELNGFFEQIELQYKQLLPFVVYRKPNATEVLGLLQRDKLLFTTSDYTETGFVFAPFDNREDTILIPFEHSVQRSAMFSNDGISSEKSESSVIENPANKKFHVNLVQKGIDAIKNDELRKVVLSRREINKLSEANPLEIFKQLVLSYSTAFVYCFYHPEVGLWLGATPETLLKIEGHRFFTTALAGTQEYKDTLNVEWKPKEIEEQNMVTNFIVENLKFSVKDLKVENVHTVKAGSMLHLKTNISGILDFKTLSLKQVLSILHPTPAVCGLPKEDAKLFILEHENYQREFYTGFLGELNFKEKKLRNSYRYNVENDAYSTVTTVSNLFVNLRCMQLKLNEAIVYVGGGITKDSNPEAEWEETVNKTQTIKSVI